jgi:hypothetical protein
MFNSFMVSSVLGGVLRAVRPSIASGPRLLILCLTLVCSKVLVICDFVRVSSSTVVKIYVEFSEALFDNRMTVKLWCGR